MAKTRKKILGLKFGMLSVLRDAKPPANASHRTRNRYVLCQCDCGRKTSVRVDHLRRGQTRSCGCLSAEARWMQGMQAVLADDADAVGAYQREYAAVIERSQQFGAASVKLAATIPLDSGPRRLKAEARHDLPAGTYAQMMTEQEGVCAICREPPGVEALNVDHCHTTGKIRGLLCRPCNHGLGFFRDDLNRLAGAMRYLTTGRAVK